MIDISRRRVSLICDTKLIEAASLIPNLRMRSKMVIELIKAYGLLSKLNVVPARKATQDDLLTFHSRSYLEYLQKQCSSVPGREPLSSSCDTEHEEASDDDHNQEFGLGYDCPVLNNMTQFVELIAGASLTAAELLISGQSNVAINWCGGWHHAQRDEASGFCYVNDIVIAIQALQRHFKKILYIDLDAHHGDGVENAFSFSKNVSTLSIHQFEPGYFPGTGDLSDIGNGKGRHYAINIPVKSGITDRAFTELFSSIFKPLLEKFPAEAIVLQCGADSLAGDPLGIGNLTERGYGDCLQRILDANLPTLILGGGGYDQANTARCWAYLTSIVCLSHLDSDIPDNPYFLEYGPTFELHINPTLRKDENTAEYLANIIETVKANIQLL